MPETRLTRALLSAIVFGVIFIFISSMFRIVLWLFDGDYRWMVVFALVVLVGFVYQWWADRGSE